MKAGSWILMIAVAVAATGCLTPAVSQRLDELEERVTLLEKTTPVVAAAGTGSSVVAASLADKIRALDAEIEVLKNHLGEKHMKVIDTQARRDRLANELKKK
ncbi:MAG: hypothetical protein HQ559_15795 [Lentisphaerae bacterium]|nr:hypothetical protein [Lentisphaerota bacterium]